MRFVARLWRGEVTLRRAFWTYGILIGFVLTLAATIAAFAALTRGESMLALAIHLVPIPYHLLALGGVWRSAERYGGPPNHATLAKAAIVVWTLVMVVV